MITLAALAVTFVLSVPAGTPRPPRDTIPAIPEVIRRALAESFRLADATAEQVWPGWGDVPFPVLLVTESTEYLVRHSRPDSTFQSIGEDPLLRGTVYARPRQFSPNLLATFPAVGGIATVVVGAPDATDRDPVPWVITLLHEHFHQYQMSRPWYYAGVERLDLSDGDQSGMWMLNYPFPYDSADVAEAFTALQQALRDALSNGGGLEQVRRAVTRLYDLLGERDRRYLEFQLWQEGISRYTEIAVARLRPAYAAEATRLREAVLDQLTSLRLDQGRRVAFYATGAALGLLLEQTDGWRERYWSEPFTLHLP